MKSNRIINFILVLICLGIVGFVGATMLEFFGIIELPKEISVKALFSDEKYDEMIKEDTEEKIVRQVVVTNTSTDGNVVYSYKEDKEYMNPTRNVVEVAEPVEQELPAGREDAYYYNQLNDTAKKIYISLYNNKSNLKSGLFLADFGLEFNSLLHQEGGIEELEEAFQLSINALTFDDPEIFYIDPKKVYLLTEITTYNDESKEYRVKIGANNGVSYLADSFSTEQSVNDALNNVKIVKDAIVKRADEEAKVKDKIKVVHDYLIDTVSYDQTIQKPNIYNAYGALISREAVCEGYARAFKYILDELEIPCIIVCGEGQNSNGETESHAWNYVKVDDVWYAVDVTWDDPIITGGSLTNELKYKYFLVGSREFTSSHKEDGYIVPSSFRFTYPNLSFTDYK